METRSRHARTLALGAAAVAAMLVAACGSSGGKGGGTSTVTTKKDAQLAGMLPAKIKSAGKIVVATDASYAPNEFFGPDNKTIVGMDADLAKAIGEVLGVRANVVNASFDSIIPGLAAGKYDLGMSSFTDNKKREATVDFVTYFSAGTSLMVKKGNPGNLSPDNLCGKKVAVEKGTTQLQDDLPVRSKTCTTAGKPAITPLVYPDQNGANLALSSGRADAVLADSPVQAYAAKQSNGQFEVTGQSYDTAPYGIAIPKNDGQFKDAVLGAVKDLLSDGTYAKILKKWGVEAGAITAPVINGATG